MAPYRAPDGGWGWVIVAACFVIRIFLYGMTTTSGILYIIFLDEFGAGKAKTAIVGSLITASGYFVGTFAGGLVNKIGCRLVVLIAGILASTGLIVSMFAVSVEFLIITYGVVTGIGFGMCYVPCSVLVSQYFEKKRNLALGLAAGGGGVGAFLFPILLRKMIVIFGWRGTLLLCGGMSLNVCVCAALMRPPEGYSHVEYEAKNKKGDNESETGENKESKIQIVVTNVDEKEPKVTETLLPSDWENANVETGEKERQSVEEKTTKKASFFYWDIFRDPKFLILAVNNFLFSFAVSVVYVHMMAFLKDVLDIEEDQSALLLTAMGVTILVAKIGTGFLATHPNVNEHVIYFVFILLAGVCTIGIPFAQHFAIWVAFASVFGAGYAVLGGCLLPTLCVQYLGVKRLPSSYGVLLVMEGFGHFIGAPCAGWLYQYTGVYANSFYLAGVMTVVSAVIMIIPWKCLKYQEVDLEAEDGESIQLTAPNSPGSPVGNKRSLMHIHKSFLSIHDVALSREQLFGGSGELGPAVTPPRNRKDSRGVSVDDLMALNKSNESLRTKMLKRKLLNTRFGSLEFPHVSNSMPKLAC